MYGKAVPAVRYRVKLRISNNRTRCTSLSFLRLSTFCQPRNPSVDKSPRDDRESPKLAIFISFTTSFQPFQPERCRCQIVRRPYPPVLAIPSREISRPSVFLALRTLEDSQISVCISVIAWTSPLSVCTLSELIIIPWQLDPTEGYHCTLMPGSNQPLNYVFSPEKTTFFNGNVRLPGSRVCAITLSDPST